MTTAIIGGGIAGIASALALQRQWKSYILYEKCNDLDTAIYNSLPNFDLIFIDTDHIYE